MSSPEKKDSSMNPDTNVTNDEQSPLLKYAQTIIDTGDKNQIYQEMMATSAHRDINGNFLKPDQEERYNLLLEAYKNFKSI